VLLGFAAGAVAFVGGTGTARADILSESFESGIPLTWSIEDYQSGGSGIMWQRSSDTGRGNYTGGTGLAAMADAASGGDGIEFDIALLTPLFRVPTGGDAELRFIANYQNFAGHDFAEVDIDASGGGGWINLLSWNEDHGDSFFRPIGEAVSLSLDAWAGEDVRIRFHYFDPGVSDWDYYWQIDDVVVTPAPGAGVIAVLGAGLLSARRRRPYDPA
jgi:hypothetical protein